ncbi:MAG: hypothetical protein RR573_02105 [Oscillospiraceae bacterium]
MDSKDRIAQELLEVIKRNGLTYQEAFEVLEMVKPLLNKCKVI